MPQPLSRATAVCEDLCGPSVGPGRGWGSPSVLRAGAGLMAAVCLLVCLQDSVLAFWSHGMQGRSLDTNEVSGTREPGLP